MQLVSIGSEPTQARLSKEMGPVPWPKKALFMAVLSVAKDNSTDFCISYPIYVATRMVNW